MAYIEAELKKRRAKDGAASSGDGGENFDAEREIRALDPRDELFRVAEKYRFQNSQPSDEGNVATSSAMLTAIPEVDLGIELVARFAIVPKSKADAMHFTLFLLHSFLPISNRFPSQTQ